jgi:hypothetical protein
LLIDRPRRDDVSLWSSFELNRRLQALLHSEELRIAKGLPEAGTLVAELQNFRATISDTGYASFGARSGKHDDLVLALAISLWWLCGPSGAGRMRVQQLNL